MAAAAAAAAQPIVLNNARLSLAWSRTVLAYAETAPDVAD